MPIYTVDNIESIFSTPESRQVVLENAERFMRNPAGLNSAAINEIAAAAYLLFQYSNPRTEDLDKKAFMWADFANRNKEKLGKHLLTEMLQSNRGTPSKNLKDNQAKALALLNECVSDRQADHIDFRLMGNFYFRTNNFSLAQEAYNRSIQIKPDYPFGLIALAEFYKNKSNLKSALENYEKALKLLPDKANLWNQTACIHFELISATPAGSQQEYAHHILSATQLFQKELTLNPLSDSAEYHLGYINYKFKSENLPTVLQNKIAFKFFNNVIARNPNHTPSLLELGKMFRDRDGILFCDKTTSDKKAIEYFERIRQQPNSIEYCEATICLANMYINGLGTPTQDKKINSSKAFDLLYPISQLKKPNNKIDYSNLNFSLGTLYLAGYGNDLITQSEKDMKAYQLFKTSNQPRFSARLGMMHLFRRTPAVDKKAGNAEETDDDKLAFKFYNLAAKANLKDANIYYDLAFMYLYMKGVPSGNRAINLKSAIELLTKAQELAPNNEIYKEAYSALLEKPTRIPVYQSRYGILDNPFSSAGDVAVTHAPATSAAAASAKDMSSEAYIKSLLQTIEAQKQTIETQQMLIKALQQTAEKDPSPSSDESQEPAYKKRRS